ncbi:hypothetical protein C0966_05590 [Bacillus methanolicus]|nr:hypothetical protein [Bacillus methanolicus]
MAEPVIHFFLPKDFSTILCPFTTSLHFHQFLFIYHPYTYFDYKLLQDRRIPIGKKVFVKVVVPNKNVIAILNGHYHDSEMLISEVDNVYIKHEKIFNPYLTGWKSGDKITV